MKHLIKALFLFTALTGIAHSATGSLVASQTSCTAPCAVHFDATGTTDTSVAYPFKDLRYVFEFDDPTSGVWATTGLSKNRESGGPIAAHIFDNPGSYDVNLKVEGDLLTEVTITVADPDTTWSGSATTCLSTNADFTGCPSGSTESTVGSWPSWTDDHRYMLHAGQDFTSLGSINPDQEQNIRITSFGSGAKPLVASVQIQRQSGNYSQVGDPWAKHVDIIGLSTPRIDHNMTGKHILLYQNTITAGNGIQLALAYRQQVGSYANMYTPQNLFVVETTMNTGTINKFTGEGQTIWMGNVVRGTKEHNMRIWQSWKTFIAHNDLQGYANDGGKAIIKAHAGSLNPITDIDDFMTERPASRYMVISHNLLNSPSSPATMWTTNSVKPQDRVQGEGIEDVILEFNTHYHGAGTDGPGGAGAYLARNIVRRGEVHVGSIGCPRPSWQLNEVMADWDGPYHIGTSGSCYQDEPIPAEPTGGGGGNANIQISKTAISQESNPDRTEQTVEYTITAINTGDISGDYNLTDTMYLGTGITLTSASVSYAGGSDVQDTSPSTPFTSGTQIVTAEALGAGNTESWTIQATYAVNQGTLTDTVGSAQCDTASNTATGGLSNVVTTDRAENSTTNDKACIAALVYVPPPPTGGVELSQVVTTGPSTGTTQTVVYTITAVNSDTVNAHDYDITETFYPGVGLTVSTGTPPTIVYATGAGSNGSVTTPFTSGTLVVETENIGASSTETWTVTVVYDVDYEVMTPTVGSGECSASATGNGGFSMRLTTDYVGDDPINNRACTPAIAEVGQPSAPLKACWYIVKPEYNYESQPTTQEISDDKALYDAGDLPGVEYVPYKYCEVAR